MARAVGSALLLIGSVVVVVVIFCLVDGLMCEQESAQLIQQQER